MSIIMYRWNWHGVLHIDSCMTVNKYCLTSSSNDYRKATCCSSSFCKMRFTSFNLTLCNLDFSPCEFYCFRWNTKVITIPRQYVGEDVSVQTVTILWANAFPQQEIMYEKCVFVYYISWNTKFSKINHRVNYKIIARKHRKIWHVQSIRCSSSNFELKDVARGFQKRLKVL